MASPGASAQPTWRLDLRHLQDRSTRRHFHGGNTPCIEHYEPIAVSTVQHAGSLRQRRDDVVHHFGRAGRSVMLIRDIDFVSANEPDSQHDLFHAPQTRRARGHPP